MISTLVAASIRSTSPEASRCQGNDIQLGRPQEDPLLSKTRNSGDRPDREVQPIEVPTQPTTVRVLIADDHSVVRRGLAAWLDNQSGFEIVEQVDSAKEAVAKTILLRPDIVLMDVCLPVEGGVCATSQTVRASPGTKVLAFSASGDPVHVRGMLAAGARGYVLKTSEPSTILSAIRAALSDSRFLDPGLSDSMIEELDIFPAVSNRARDVLTGRETQVLQHIVWGCTNREIAFELNIKATSVNTYRHRFCDKLGLRSRAEIVRYGIAVGLIKGHPPTRRPPRSVEPEFPLASGIGFRKRS